MENPHKRGNIDIFYAAPQLQVTHYPKESGGLCGNGGALGYQVGPWNDPKKHPVVW
jgi:hypothetical protein